MSSHYKVLLVGGQGSIGAGLRTYLPRLDKSYRVISVDLPGAEDKAVAGDAAGELVELDFVASPAKFAPLVADCDLVVYLARCHELEAMRRMTDLVYETVLAQDKPQMLWSTMHCSRAGTWPS